MPRTASGRAGPASAAARPPGGPTHRRLADLTVLVPEDASVGSLSAVAYYLIRDMVVTLALEPGSPVHEPDLMRTLGLGRTPVREALRRLADEGLVTVYARRGMVVSPVRIDDLAGICEVRVELEGFAARLAARRATDRDRAAGEVLAAELDRLPASDDELALIRLDQRVHQHVHRAAHNPHLQSTLTEYLTLSLRLWFVGLDQVTRLDEAVREHRDLLQAVADGDPDRAEAVTRAHVTGFQREIGRVLSLPS